VIRRTRFGVYLAFAVVMAAMIPWSISMAQQAEKKETPPAAAAAPAAAAPAEAAPPAAPMVNSIRIVFDDRAKNNGEIAFVFTPEGGTAKLIKVTIANKEDKRDAARDSAKELSVALGAGYKVRQDGDTVKVEGLKKAKFSLSISSLTANGLSVRLK